MEKNCKFTLSTPTVVLTGADAEFGIEGDRVGDGWIPSISRPGETMDESGGRRGDA